MNSAAANSISGNLLQLPEHGTDAVMAVIGRGVGNLWRFGDLNMGSHNSKSIARSPVAIAEYTARSLSTFSSDIAQEKTPPSTG